MLIFAERTDCTLHALTVQILSLQLFFLYNLHCKLSESSIKPTFEDLSKEICVVFVVEGRITTEEDVGYYTCDKHIVKKYYTGN
jgi:hypothetical protein